MERAIEKARRGTGLVAIAARYDEAADALAALTADQKTLVAGMNAAEQRIKELTEIDAERKPRNSAEEYSQYVHSLEARLAAAEAERDALLKVAEAARAWDKHRRTFGYNTFCDEERALANAVAALDALPTAESYRPLDHSDPRMAEDDRIHNGGVLRDRAETGRQKGV